MTRVEVWNSDCGYLVPKTNTIETEVVKVLQLWDESDALTGYCPLAKEQKLYEYNSTIFEIGTVTEHTGVVFVCLFMKE